MGSRALRGTTGGASDKHPWRRRTTADCVCHHQWCPACACPTHWLRVHGPPCIAKPRPPAQGLRARTYGFVLPAQSFLPCGRGHHQASLSQHQANYARAYMCVLFLPRSINHPQVGFHPGVAHLDTYLSCSRTCTQLGNVAHRRRPWSWARVSCSTCCMGLHSRSRLQCYVITVNDRRFHPVVLTHPPGCSCMRVSTAGFKGSGVMHAYRWQLLHNYTCAASRWYAAGPAVPQSCSVRNGPYNVVRCLVRQHGMGW